MDVLYRAWNSQFGWGPLSAESAELSLTFVTKFPDLFVTDLCVNSAEAPDSCAQLWRAALGGQEAEWLLAASGEWRLYSWLLRTGHGGRRSRHRRNIR